MSHLELNTVLNEMLRSLSHPFYVTDVNDYTMKFAYRLGISHSSLGNSTCYSAIYGLDGPCNKSGRRCPLQEMSNTLKPVTFQDAHQRPDGSAKRVKIQAYPMLDEEGKIARAVVHCLDTSQQSQFHEPYRAIFDLLPDGVMVETDGFVTFANKSLATILGYKSEDELIGKNVITDVVSRECREIAMERRRLLRYESKPIPLLEEKYLKADGTLVDIEVAGRPLRNNGRDGSILVVRDISDRKKAEAALIRKREEQALLLENITTMVWYLIDPQTCGAVNRAFAEFWGTHKENMENRSIYELLKQDEADLWVERNLEIFRTKASTYSEELVANAKGERKLLGITKTPKLDDKGEVEYVICSAEDITERKMMEDDLARAVENLRQSNAETQALLECSKALLAHTEFQWSARLIFHSCERLIGATSGFISVVKPSGLQNEVLYTDPGPFPCDVDPELPVQLRGLREKVFRTGKPLVENNFDRSECAELLPEGHPTLINVLLVPLLIEDRVVGFMGLANKEGGFSESDLRLGTAFAEFASIGLSKARTLEALEQSEERYRLLFSKERDAIMVADVKSFQILDVNEAAERFWGYSREALLEMNATDVSFEPDKSRLTLEVGAASAGVLVPLRWHKKKDGTVFPVEVSVSPLTWNGRRVVCVMVRDITERRKAEELQLQSERLKAVADLASGVSHNFNNLLQIIMGGTQLIRMNIELGNLEDVAETLDQIMESCAFGTETVKRLQSYANVRRETNELATEVFDLSEVVNQSVEMTKTWWKIKPAAKGIRIRLHKKLTEGCRVKGQKSELFEIVVNLIKNAAEALPGDGDIFVETCQDIHQVILTVRDTGTGIKEKDMERLFTPFFTTKQGTGTGLGLAASRRIIADHNGRILVDSVEGQGCTFTVFLPLAETIENSTGVE